MADGKVALTEEENREILEYIKEAVDRHVKSVPTIVPGFAAREFDEPITLPPWNVTLEAGTYFLRLPQEGANVNDGISEDWTWVYTFDIDPESVRQAVELAEDTDRKTAIEWNEEDAANGEPPEIAFKFNMQRLDLAEGRPLDYIELLGWHAAHDADRAGDADRVRRIFELLYKGSYGSKASNLPRQDVRKLHRQNDPISKVSNVMTNPALFGEGGAILDVAGAGEKRRGREVNTAVTFSWEGEGVEIFRPISQYDREVHGALSSLWADGQRNVTPHQIAKAMGIRNPTKRQVENVVESVDLQRRVLGKIDFTEEARGRSLEFEGEPVTSFKLEGYLIAADKAEIGTANGRVTQGYIMHRAPLMYQHAATLGQVVNYPQSLLGMGEGSDTVQNIILRRELIRRVYTIKNKYKKARGEKRQEVNRNVRFTTDDKHPGRSLFERANVKQGNRDTRKRAMDYVFGLLDGLAERGEIADYKPVTETGRGGTRTVGAEVIL